MKTLLNAKENEAAARFVWDHYKRRCKPSKSAKVELFAESNGMGFSIKVRCPHCLATEDISDVDSW